MAINQDVFFSSVRSSPFMGHLQANQVSGLLTLLTFWDNNLGTQDIRWLAYALATAYHETSGTMQPVAEYGLGEGHSYGFPDPTTRLAYYGRGYVQLTWAANYKRLGAKLGLDLYHFPSLAMVPLNAAKIMFSGMMDGDFTGATLAEFFSSTRNDPVNARRIINGTDRASLIAAYHNDFLKALT